MLTRTSLFMVFLFLASSLFGGVIKESKSSVSFRGFGTFVATSKVKIQGFRKREDTAKKFKGQGFMGKIMATAFMHNGNSGEIIDLQNMKDYRLNHSKKEFRVTPVQKMDWENAQGQPENGEEQNQAEKEKSNIRIIRQEFKVHKTAEKKTINGFNSEKYTLKWVTVWENTETGEKGTDSLFTVVWTTKSTKEIEKAQQEEMAFTKEYMKKTGMDQAFEQSDILGMRWMGMFASMNKGQGSAYDYSDSKFAKEMKKIKGYPVLIDGKYFAIRPKTKTSAKETEEKTDISDIKSMFGGLMNKMIKKHKKAKKSSGPQVAFSYHTELLKVQTGPVPASEFQVPREYKQTDRE